MVEKISIDKGESIQGSHFLEIAVGARHDQQFVEAIDNKIKEGWVLINTIIAPNGRRIAHMTKS